MFKFAGSFYLSNFFLNLPGFLRLIIYKVRIASKLNLEIKSVLDILKKKSVIIDLGANLGIWTDYFDLCGFNVIAFEPDPDCYEFLKDRFKKKKIIIFQSAVHNKIGTMKLRYHELRDKEGFANLEYSQSTSLIHNKDRTISTKISVKTTTLKYIIHKFKPFLIKMDIEGSEIPALKKLLEEKIINKIDVPYFFIETHEKSIKGYNKELKLIKTLISKYKLNNKFIFKWE